MTIPPGKEKSVNGSVLPAASVSRLGKQRITITLPFALLERLRNAVYWTRQGPLAHLIMEALTSAATRLEQSNGQAFPQRPAPLRRGRPRNKAVVSQGNGVSED
jgi:hypothetical protein